MEINLFKVRKAEKVENFQDYFYLIEAEIYYREKKFRGGIEMFPKKHTNRFHFYYSLEISLRKGFNIFYYFNIE